MKGVCFGKGFGMQKAIGPTQIFTFARNFFKSSGIFVTTVCGKSCCER